MHTEYMTSYVGAIPILVGIIPTIYVMCRNLSYNIQQCGNISYKMSLMLPYTCRNHASYASINFGTSQKVAVFYEETCQILKFWLLSIGKTCSVRSLQWINNPEGMM